MMMMMMVAVVVVVEVELVSGGACVELVSPPRCSRWVPALVGLLAPPP